MLKYLDNFRYILATKNGLMINLIKEWSNCSTKVQNSQIQ